MFTIIGILLFITAIIVVVTEIRVHKEYEETLKEIKKRFKDKI